MVGNYCVCSCFSHTGDLARETDGLRKTAGLAIALWIPPSKPPVQPPAAVSPRLAGKTRWSGNSHTDCPAIGLIARDGNRSNLSVEAVPRAVADWTPRCEFATKPLARGPRCPAYVHSAG